MSVENEMNSNGTVSAGVSSRSGSSSAAVADTEPITALDYDEDENIDDSMMYLQSDEQETKREWRSLGSEKEILAEKIKNNRDYYINVRFYKKRKHFGKPLQSRKVDTMDTFRFLPSFKDPRYIEMRRERDVGVQSTIETVDQGMQTPWYRTTNSTTQVTLATLINDELIEHCFKSGYTDIVQFLNSVEPAMVEALEQNVNIEIRPEEFINLFMDDSFFDKKSESQLREHADLSNSEFTKKKKITSIHWQPRAKGIISVASVDDRSIDKRYGYDPKTNPEQFTLHQSSYVVVWDYNDPIWPQLVLEAPCDIQCIEFNPSDPKILVGGLVNGQIILWNLDDANRPEQSVIDMMGREKLPSQIRSLPYRQLSLIEASHDGPVYAIRWINNKVFNDSGELVPHPTTDQFLTTSSDGRLLVWDKNEEFVLPSKKAIKIKSERLRGKWIPVNMWNVWKLDNSAPLSICSMDYVPDTGVYLGTQDGEFVLADIGPIARKSSLLDDEHGGYKTFNNLTVAKSIHQKHYSAVHTVQVHPQFSDIVLTIGSHEIHIWKCGCHCPIWTSPFRESYLTSGTWSPTRPGVLFIGRHDGILEAWNFMDKSHSPSLEHVVYQNVELSSIQFLKAQTQYSQFLAVGTSQGVLHVMEVPRNLSKVSPNEADAMRKFFDRESQKVHYYERRFEYHKKNAEEMKRAFKGSMGDGGTDAQSNSNNKNQQEGELTQEKKMELEKIFREITTKDSASLIANDEN